MLQLLRNALLLLVTLSVHANAQQSEKFGPYELYYSVVNTTFLSPEVAATYNITRGDKRAILNLSVREALEEGSTARTMTVKGTTWDLIHKESLQFREVREGEAIYYIAEFAFINEELRFFELEFLPSGAQESYTFKFKQQLYID